MNLFYLWAKILKKLRGSAIINSKIHPTSKIESGSHIVNSTFDCHSFCGYDCEIINCEIGSFCSISDNVIIGGGMHPMDWVSMSPVFYEGRDSVKTKYFKHKRDKPLNTIIGNDVWIGNRAIIKQGIIIGTGAVIGMGSVVTKNVESYTIVAGNPAKVIRKRFDEETIRQLLDSEWWNYDNSLLLELGPYFKYPKDFIQKTRNRSSQ